MARPGNNSRRHGSLGRGASRQRGGQSPQTAMPMGPSRPAHGHARCGSRYRRSRRSGVSAGAVTGPALGFGSAARHSFTGNASSGAPRASISWLALLTPSVGHRRSVGTIARASTAPPGTNWVQAGHGAAAMPLPPGGSAISAARLGPICDNANRSSTARIAMLSMLHLRILLLRLFPSRKIAGGRRPRLRQGSGGKQDTPVILLDGAHRQS